MDLEIIALSKISQKEKGKYYIWYDLHVGFKYDTGTSLVGNPPASEREAGLISGWVTGTPHAKGQISLHALIKIWHSQEWIRKYIN